MDNTDIKIINILQKNCKASTRDIGKEVGLTAPAVAERINRLKDSGVIEGFHAQINETLLGNNISAYIMVNVPPRDYAAFCRFCEESPSISEHHHIVGLNNHPDREFPDAGQTARTAAQVRPFQHFRTSFQLL